MIKIKKILFIIPLTFLIVGCSKNVRPTTKTTNSSVTTSTSKTTEKIINRTTRTKTTTENTTTKIYPYDEVTPSKNGYDILWSDEFNGEKLNDSIWHREQRPAGWTNYELQEYVANEENGFVRDGNFVIKGIEYQSGKYTSCKIRNNDSYAFKYGRVEVRAKAPEGFGLWPAIWMMPEEEDLYGQWPKCGEIDIMELTGDNVKKAYGTVHYGEPHTGIQEAFTLTDGSFASDFHDFAIEWEPGRIEWFVDGVSYLVVTDWFSASDEVENEWPAPFNQKFCIQINLAIGGSWPGYPEPNASYMDNAEFYIDYVRVYQKEDGYNENVSKPQKLFRDPDATGNYITDSTFTNPIGEFNSDNTLGWFSHIDDGANASFSTQVINGENVMCINVMDEVGTYNHSIQLLHTVIPFINGKNYKISFDCWASEEATINEVCIDAPNVGWARYWTQSITCTTTKTSYQYSFTMSHTSDNSARLEFNMGNSLKNVTIYITNVRVEMEE